MSPFCSWGPLGFCVFTPRGVKSLDEQHPAAGATPASRGNVAALARKHRHLPPSPPKKHSLPPSHQPLISPSLLLPLPPPLPLTLWEVWVSSQLDRTPPPVANLHAQSPCRNVGGTHTQEEQNKNKTQKQIQNWTIHWTLQLCLVKNFLKMYSFSFFSFLYFLLQRCTKAFKNHFQLKTWTLNRNNFEAKQGGE